MFKGKTLDQLSQLSKMAVEQSKQLDSQIKILDETIAETLRNAPEEQKSKIEEIQGLTTKALNLAKMGKTDQVNELIKKFNNGSKNNR